MSNACTGLTCEHIRYRGPLPNRVVSKVGPIPQTILRRQFVSIRGTDLFELDYWKRFSTELI